MRLTRFALAAALGAGLSSGTPVPATAADDPGLASFQINTDGAMGSSPDADMNALTSAIEADVQQVHYTDSNIYVETTGVPSYPTGAFPDGNPSYASDLAAIYSIPRNPEASSATEDTALGAIGVFVNGVAIFNPEDGRTYQNQNVWHQNAIVVEADGFDDCNGHPAPLGGGGPPPGPGGGLVAGIYHHHMDPVCLLAQLGEDAIGHSGIAGWSFDGYPVYGPWGYADPEDASSAIVRIDSSYQERAITTRTTLPGGTALAAPFYGPNVSSIYPLGYFMEDFEYIEGLGHLDEHNGRFAVTPEYPSGIYAYYVTIDDQNDAAYPYFVGAQYYGVPSGGAVASIPAEAVVFVPEAAAVPMSIAAQMTLGAILALTGLRRQRRPAA